MVYLNCLTLPQGEVKVQFLGFLCEEEVLVNKMIQLGYIRIKTISKFLGQKIRIIHHENLVFVTQMYLYIIYALYIMYMICMLWEKYKLYLKPTNILTIINTSIYFYFSHNISTTNQMLSNDYLYYSINYVSEVQR